MENKNIEDIKAIRSMMEQSSRFISLSGWSGILAGIYALIAAVIAHGFLNYALLTEVSRNRNEVMLELAIKLLTLGLITLFLAISTGILLTVKKSKKKGIQVWTKTTQRLLIHLFVPLIVGAIFCVVFYFHHVSYLIGATTLIFYGLALLNASKFTLNDVAYLGYLQILIGVINLMFPELTLLFWAFGFGVLHIVYGILIQRKYH